MNPYRFAELMLFAVGSAVATAYSDPLMFVVLACGAVFYATLDAR
jgi:hypothetical protein